MLDTVDLMVTLRIQRLRVGGEHESQESGTPTTDPTARHSEYTPRTAVPARESRNEGTLGFNIDDRDKN